MKPRHIALAVLVAVIWGFNFVVIRVGLDAMSPLLFCAVRFLVAAVPAVFFVGRPTVKWRWIAASASVTSARITAPPSHQEQPSSTGCGSSIRQQAMKSCGDYSARCSSAARKG